MLLEQNAGNHDDGKEVVLLIDEELGISIEIESHDLQRAHRLGKKFNSQATTDNCKV